MSDGTCPPPASDAGASADVPSAALLLRMFDALPVLVSYVDADERYRFCNRAYEQMFGTPRAELVGKTVRELIGEEAYQRVQPSIRSALAGQSVQLEQVLPYARAGNRLVAVHYTPDVRPDGTVEGYIVLVRDVTEQRRRDEALRGAEPFRLALLGTPDAVWDWDVPKDLLQWSSGLATRFGYTPPAPVTGYSWWRERVHPDDVARVEDSLRSALEGEASSWQADYRFRRSDGTWADVVDRAFVLRDAQGRAVRVAGSVQDVSERQALLHAVAQRSAELEAVLQAIPDAVYVADHESVQWANAEALALFGVDRDELKRTPRATLRERLAVRDPETLAPIPEERSVFTRALEGQTGSSEVLVHHVTSDEDRVLRISAAPVRVEGRSTEAVMVMVDVTERKRLERERDEAAAQLSSLVAAAPACIGLVDSELRYVRVNDAYAAISGRPAADHPGRTLHEVLPGIAPQVEPFYRHVLQTGEPLVGKEVNAPSPLAPERHGTWLASYYPVRDAAGRVESVGVVIMDITRQRLAEEQMRRTAGFRDMFLSIVSHDLRTPLQAVTLAVRTLQGMALQPAAAQRLVERIGSSAERMNGMIVQLLDFARGRLGGGIPVEARPMDLEECVRHVLEELRVARPEVEVRFHAQGDCRGEWDEDRLAQVVQNLVGNALKHGAPGTTEVDLEGAPDAVLLTVRNQGSPIPAEVLPQLFEPFRSGAEAERRSSGNGLGLGLFITREIVLAHGGDISARSSAEEGTAFTVRLPRQHPLPAG